MEKARFDEIISRFRDKSILVIGDLMVDAYLWGNADRISPEAPVPIVHITETNSNPGGAGNVVKNLSELGAQVSILGVIGNDHQGKALVQHFNSSNVDTSGILVDDSRPTSIKTRVIAHNQQVVRIDQESLQPYSQALYTDLRTTLKNSINDVDAVILEDYNKGLFNPGLIEWIITTCRENGTPVYVDPKKHNIASFSHVRLFKPNFPEFLGCISEPYNESELSRIGMDLRTAMDVEILMVTRGKDGIALFTADGLTTIPTKARKVHDVSGAGDSVISTFTLADISGASPEESAMLANYAAGKVCEEVGVVPISIDKLSEIVTYHHS